MVQLRASPIPSLLLLLPLLLWLVQPGLPQQSSNTSYQHERNLLGETHTDHDHDHHQQDHGHDHHEQDHDHDHHEQDHDDHEHGRNHEAEHSKKGGFIDIDSPALQFRGGRKMVKGRMSKVLSVPICLQAR